jgi:hypothetical protein
LYFGEEYEDTPEYVFDGFRISWRSTLTIYENEYLCRIGEGEFNFTSNPTILNVNSPDTVNDRYVNEDFNPYITTIGLYDKHGRLLVVGKLNSPIKKRDDVDLNIIVKFDI